MRRRRFTADQAQRIWNAANVVVENKHLPGPMFMEVLAEFTVELQCILLPQRTPPPRQQPVKRAVVEQLLAEVHSDGKRGAVRRVAERHGIPPQSLYNWMSMRRRGLQAGAR